MDFFFVLIGISIQGIFIIRRELLYEKKSSYTLLIVSLLFFILSYVLIQIHFGKPGIIVLLRVPMLTMLIFYLMKIGYFKLYQTDAKDTFWSMDVKLMKDGIFNFLFGVVGLLVSIFLAYEIL
jgi:hypothetical protein